MALPAALQALFDRLQTYNSDAYNASTNPGGFARGGNQKPVDNFIKSVRDFTAFGKGISDLTSSASADAQATAADRVQTGQDRTASAASASSAAQSETRAQGWADAPENTEVLPGKYSARHWAAKAAAWAAGVSLPAISAANALQFLQVKPDGTGYQTASLDLTAATDMLRVARTANTALAKSDKNKLIDITAGTFTQTFDAAASLGNGWSVRIRNSGSGDITLDPSGSETIDGLTSFIMYPGEARLIHCDGAALRSIVLQPFYKVFTASDNFIKPPGYKLFRGLAWSGGSSGGRHTNTANHVQGGNGGGCFPFDFRSDDLAAATAITIGAGGAPITSEVLSGNPGGNTSLGSLLTVFGAAKDNGGGIRTSGVTANDSGFAGPSVGGNGYSTVFGGATSTSNANATGGSSIYGGAGGAPIQGNSNTAGFAGTSVFGGNGGAANAYGKPGDGAAPGGGGGATRSGADASGAGGRGELRIWGVA